MDSTWLPIVAAFIGAMAVVVGNALNPFVNSARSHKLWVRDKRAEVLEEFMSLVNQANDALSDVDLAKSRLGQHVERRLPHPEEKYAEAIGAYRESVKLYNRMYLALARVMIYASSDITAKAQEAVGNYQVACYTRDPESGEAFSDLAVDAGHAFARHVDSLLALTRKELKVK